MDRTTGQKINKEMENLNNTINHSTQQEDIHFSQVLMEHSPG